MDDLRDDSILAGVPEIDGYKVLDPCVLYAKLGQGGMGAVYRGRHLNLDVEVAVKCLRRALAEDNADFIRRFQREAKVAAAINDPHLVRVYDVREAHGLHYLVMEYVPGEDARQRVSRKGALDVAEAAALVLGAARGLAAAHGADVVHRDIKPDNILISQAGIVKVADLGLARAAQAIDSVATASHMVMGTPSYMPPEQFEGAAKVDKQSDVWALGATLWFLLVGRNAIEAGSLTEVMRRVCLEPFPDIADARPGLPADLVEVIRKATLADMSARYADAGALADALEAVVGSDTSALVDAASGEGIGPTMISPPPQQSLTRMRTAVAGGVVEPPRVEALAEVATVAGSSPAAAAMDSPATPGSKGARSKAPLAALAVLAVVIVAVVAFLLTRDEKPDDTDPPAHRDDPRDVVGDDGTGPRGRRRFKNRLAAADALGERPERLDDAIAAFESLRRENGGRPEISNRLAIMLGRRAALQRDRGELVEARADAVRALGLTGDPRAKHLAEELARAIKDVLAESVTVDRPAPGAVISKRWVVIEGAVTSPIVAAIQVNGVPAAIAADRHDARLEKLAEGTNTIVLAIEASDGVRVERTHEIVVDSTAPRIEVDWPEKSVPPGRFELRGRVDDATTCIVHVNDLEAESAGDGWAATLELAEGDNTIVVVASDAAGNSSSPTLRTITAASAVTPPPIEVPSPISEPAAPFTVGEVHRYRYVSRMSESSDPTDVYSEGVEFRLEVVETRTDGGARVKLTYERFSSNDPDELTALRPMKGKSFHLIFDRRGRISSSPDIVRTYEYVLGDDVAGREALADLQYAFIGRPPATGKEWTRTTTLPQEDIVLTLTENCTSRPMGDRLVVSAKGTVQIAPTEELRTELLAAGASLQLDSNASSIYAEYEGVFPRRITGSVDLGIRSFIGGVAMESQRIAVNFELHRRD